MAAKEIEYGAKAREKMMKGVDTLADAVNFWPIISSESSAGWPGKKFKVSPLK